LKIRSHRPDLLKRWERVWTEERLQLVQEQAERELLWKRGRKAAVRPGRRSVRV
jgi:hypothetical protein